MTDKIALQLDQVQFSYPETALMQFDCSVPKGARLAVLGASGSGKSTLLHLIAGFELPHEGRIFIGDQQSETLPPEKRPLTFVFQDNNLFDHLTVWQNIGLGRAPNLKLKDHDLHDITEAINAVGLMGKEKRLPSELSGGERQRVALARVMVRNHPLVLLDEPFASLGPALRDEMLGLTLELQSRLNLTVMMVTHDVCDAKSFATHIGFVDQGKMLGLMLPEALDNPENNTALLNYLGARH